MLQSLNAPAQIVLPLFLLLGLGMLLRHRGILKAQTLDDLNDLSFQILLPLSMFQNLYGATLADLYRPKLVLFALGSQLLILLALFVFIPRMEPDRSNCASLVQGIFRVNTITFGFAIVGAVGDAEAISAVSVVGAFLIPFLNLGAIWTFEHFCGKKGKPGEVLFTMVTNPFVVAFMLALVFIITGIRLPAFMEKTLSDVAAIASPVSLIALGGCIQFSSLKTYRRQLWIGVVGRLLVVPALFLPLCLAAGFQGGELLALLVVQISPTAVAGFTMAQQMNANGELAGHLVVLQSAFSVLTIFFWLWVINWMGYL